MSSDSYLPQTKFSTQIDRVIIALGKFTSLIWVILLGVIVFNVVMRYAFNEGSIELEELQWHLYSMGFLLGLSFAYQADAHIRVDVLHERMSDRLKAWIELYGTIIFVLPFIALIIVYSLPFIASSFALGEVSPSPGGLPFRWFIKAFLPIGYALLLLAVASRLLRVWSFLFLQSHTETSPTNNIGASNGSK